jgi:hypothetical protein
LSHRARVRAWLPCRIGRCGLPDWDRKIAEACAAVHPRRRNDGGRDARHVQSHAGRAHAGDCDRRRARRGCGTTKRMLAYEEINGSPWYLPRLAAEASRYRLTPDPLGCSQQCSGAAIGRLPDAYPTCRRRPACSWMSSTTSAQLREIGCSPVCTQPSQSAEARRVAQQAHAAAGDGGSQQFAHGTRTRPTAGATVAALVHRASPPCNRQSTTRPPVTQSGEDEWSPRLNYPRLAARGTHVELYTSATRALR